MSSSKLFEPYELGSLALRNRIVMAPMTRSRAGAGMAPRQSAATYYGQRASAGLIIAEASQVSQQGQGYQDTPGIYSKEQVAGWRRVTEKVHERGGRIFLQLWHVGRISHTFYQPNNGAPIAPSAIRPNAKTFVNGEFVDVSQPRALELKEIPTVIEDFRRAAIHAMEARFDGVEIHGANGYLLDQFAKDGSNKRTDAYGGSIENRSRLMLDVAKAVATEVGSDRTGIRLTPVTPVNDIIDSDPNALFQHIADEISALRLVYLHVIEAASTTPGDCSVFDYKALRKRFKGSYIANKGYTLDSADKALAANDAELVSFGKLFVSNPDLVERFRKNAPLSEADPTTFYGGDTKGYTDYPSLSGVLDLA